MLCCSSCFAFFPLNTNFAYSEFHLKYFIWMENDDAKRIMLFSSWSTFFRAFFFLSQYHQIYLMLTQFSFFWDIIRPTNKYKPMHKSGRLRICWIQKTMIMVLWVLMPTSANQWGKYWFLHRKCALKWNKKVSWINPKHQYIIIMIQVYIVDVKLEEFLLFSLMFHTSQ